MAFVFITLVHPVQVTLLHHTANMVPLCFIPMPPPLPSPLSRLSPFFLLRSQHEITFCCCFCVWCSPRDHSSSAASVSKEIRVSGAFFTLFFFFFFFCYWYWWFTFTLSRKETTECFAV